MSGKAPQNVGFRVAKTEPGSTLRAGEFYPIQDGEQILGRSMEVELRLDDETVSRQHARIHLHNGLVRVESLTETNGTFINGVAAKVGESVTLVGDSPLLQVGGVLLELLADHRTRPVLSALSLEQESDTTPDHSQAMLVVIWDTTKCSVRCRDRTLDLAPYAARALSALCAEPGRPVHHWDIQEEVGAPCNVAQLISAVRRSFRLLVQEGVIHLDELRDLVRAHSSGDHLETLAEMDVNEVLRAFVMSRRGHGYQICLAETDVRIEQ
jgi:hypothetical protein